MQDNTSIDRVQIGNLVADPETYGDDGSKYYAALIRLRRDAPVCWVTPDHYRPFWMITKHADVRSIEGQPRRFLSRPRSFLMTREDEEQLIKATGSASASRSIVQLDEPDHRTLRNVTQSWFLPNAVNNLEPKIRKIAVELIDKMAGTSQTDFAADIALWFPLRVIMSILGMPAEDRDLALQWTRTTFSAFDPEVGGETGLAANLKVFQSISEYFAAISEDRRQNPRDDLATVIANAQIDGARITEVDANSYYWTVITAGHDTTSSTLSGGLLALLQNPDELAKLRQNPALIDQAVNEFLRWTTPIKHFFRTATEDYELRGEKIRAGDSLMMCYPSANRDEEVFEDSLTFKIDRPRNAHLAFGHGIHQCLGLHLAKLELRIFFEELLPRLETIELAGEPAWYKANFVVGLKRLPISYRMHAQKKQNPGS
jgi:cytochrome P450